MVIKDLKELLYIQNPCTGSLQLCKQAVMHSCLKLQEICRGHYDKQGIMLFYGQLHLQVLQVLLIYSWHELYLARACQAGSQVTPDIDCLWV